MKLSLTQPSRRTVILAVTVLGFVLSLQNKESAR
jgi:hypothetical protein